MKSIAVDNLKDGMVYDDAIYLDPNDSMVFIHAHDMILNTDIQRLRKWSISRIFTNGSLIVICKFETNDSPIEIENYPTLSPEMLSKTNFITQGVAQLFTKYPFVNNDLFTKGCAIVERVYNDIINKNSSASVHDLTLLVEDILAVIEIYPYFFIFYYDRLQNGNVYSHILMVGMVSIFLAKMLGFSKVLITDLAVGIFLMDIGMLKIEPTLLNAEKILTPEEKAKISLHTLQGYKILIEPQLRLKSIFTIPSLQHHENYDGSGYPRKLQGDAIHIYARISKIVDAFVSLLEHKPYRNIKMYNGYEAFQEMLKQSIHIYDKSYLKVFINNMSLYPVGTLVQLSNDIIGLVVGVVPQAVQKPIVLCLRTPSSHKFKKAEYIALHETDLTISKIVSSIELDLNLREEVSSIVLGVK